MATSSYDSLAEMGGHMGEEGGFFSMMRERWNGLMNEDLPADADPVFRHAWMELQNAWVDFQILARNVESRLWDAYENQEDTNG